MHNPPFHPWDVAADPIPQPEQQIKIATIALQMLRTTWTERYDLAFVEENDLLSADPPGYKYVGAGTIYSIGDVRSTDPTRYRFYRKNYRPQPVHQYLKP